MSHREVFSVRYILASTGCRRMRMRENDLPSAARKCSSESYVDDTKLLLSFRISDSNTAMTDPNEDLIRMRNWCFDNLLLLYSDKTKLMVYGSRQMLAKLPAFTLSLLCKELHTGSISERSRYYVRPNSLLQRSYYPFHCFILQVKSLPDKSC